MTDTETITTAPTRSELEAENAALRAEVESLRAFASMVGAMVAVGLETVGESAA